MFTWVEIDKKALRHNIHQFKKIIGQKKLLMPVVKANAYGHDFLTVAKICDQNREVDRICVVNSEEAMKLLSARIKKPIMILSFFTTNKKILEKLIKAKIIFPVYSLAQAQKLNQIGKGINKKIKIHLKIDTGASRLGFLPQDIKNISPLINKLHNLEVEGVWSHFASSEEDRKQTVGQFNLFKKAVKDLECFSIQPLFKHMSCTAASILFPLQYFNAIRLGLGLYGLYPSASSRKKIKLSPVLSWRTKIIHLKIVPAGTKIGYGGTYKTGHKITVATLPIGYWDGYDRGLSNNSFVLIKGQKCPVVGRICMNLTMINVSKVKNIAVGDTVTLIGKDGKNEITADDLAIRAKTINYEIVDRINPLLPRIIK